MMDKEIRYFDSELRSVEDSREINGTAAVFGKRSQMLGWFFEVIDPKAFDDCDMSDVIACRNHDPDKVMARTGSKTLTLDISNSGLHYRFEAPQTTVGNDTLEDIRVGNISKSSFAFTVKRDMWEEMEDGTELRTILEIPKLYDVSPVTNPAYLQTDVQANSLEVARRSYDEWKKEKDDEDDPNDDMAKGMTWQEGKMKILALQ